MEPAGASPIGQLIALGPDPDGAAPRLERFADLGGVVPDDADGLALLAALFSNGGFLADIVLADVERFSRLCAGAWLRRPKPKRHFFDEIEHLIAGTRDMADLQRRLRAYRTGEMLRLGAREIGWGTTEEVARELSGLADACLHAAVNFCDGQLRAAYGEPVTSGGPASFVVMAMGKLGGDELNFCSDVDLIYVYSSDEGRAGALTLHEYYERLAQDVTRALADITGDGLVFRVDLRLRPEGRSGPLCNSLAASETYYEAFGRTWERQALLRARPCAGDLALGERFVEMVRPFVYPRSVGPGAIDDVRALRSMFREDAATGPFNVKLGAGGIRDVELVAQLLQLLFAGQRAELRERTTLPALHKLALAGFVSGEEERALGTAYRFWRRVEHRLQLEAGAQTHALPADPAAMSLLSRRLGFSDPEAFAATIARHRAAVSAIADTLGEPAHAPSKIVVALLDPALPREDVERHLRDAGVSDVEAAADGLDLARGRLPAEWLEEALASPDPDRALARFRDLALRGSLGVFAFLGQHRQRLRVLASLFGTSERLSRRLISHPGMWEPLMEGLGAPRPDPGAAAYALAARTAGLDYEEALREMRRYQTEEILRIGLHDTAGNIGVVEVAQQLADLAEACLGAIISLVAATMEARFGRPDAALTVLALGSLGARDMRYGSDLDLVFLYAHAGATARGMDHQEWFARLAQRVISALGALLDEGRLYEVDTRLRPSGQQGMLVTTYEAFEKYHQESAATWERVALLRARPVFHQSADTPDDFAPLLAAITYERTIPENELRAELRRMRERIAYERGQGPPGAVHLRLSPGGLTCLEFLAAFGQLRWGATDVVVRTPSPREALERLSARGMFPHDGHLTDDYEFLQRALLRLRLLRDRSEDWLNPDDIRPLARTFDVDSVAWRDELTARMARVRTAFLRLFG